MAVLQLLLVVLRHHGSHSLTSAANHWRTKSAFSSPENSCISETSSAKVNWPTFLPACYFDYFPTPVLLCGLECCQLNKADLQFLGFTSDLLFVKLFRTGNYRCCPSCQVLTVLNHFHNVLTARK